MEKICVADVGDGLCIGIDFSNQDCMQIDCGSGNGSNYALRGYQWLSSIDIKPSSFTLSHFHKDHYNGLPEIINNNFRATIIDRVYYPKMPEFAKKDEFLRALFCMNAYLLGDETGSMEYDLLEIIRIMNGGVRPKNIPLWKGKNFKEGGYSYEVLWPPFSITDMHLIGLVEKAISSFYTALETEAELNDLHKKVTEEGAYRKYGDAEGYKENYEDYIRWAPKDRRQRKLSDEVNRANENLKDAANHLSLSFLLNDQFLFLGDLEACEINLVLSELLKNHNRSYEILITPHHGTHHHRILELMRCNYTISSVGKELCRHLKPVYKSISRHHCTTWTEGNITLISHRYPSQLGEVFRF